MRRLIAYITTLLALCACSSRLETERAGMDPSLEGKPVTFTFSVPDVRLAPATKGVDGNDGHIFDEAYLDPDKLYLVVCGGTQSIKYIRKAEVVKDAQGQPVKRDTLIGKVEDYPLPITDSTQIISMYEFKVQLELTDSWRTVHVLGNIDENQLITGSYAYQILPTLLSFEEKQAYWQKINMPPIHALVDGNGNQVIQNGSYLPSAEAAAALKHVPLIRNYAKIQVTDATAPEDGFELFSYAVIHYPKRGTVVPYRSNVNSLDDAFNFNALGDTYRFSGYERCNFQNLDEDLEYLGFMSPKVEFNHEIPDISLFEHPDGRRVIRYDKNNPDQGFYVYERNIPDDKMEPTFVIIRGRFGDTDDYYYYRLDLMETKTVNYESVYQYYPIYRNFRYNIQLNRISSVGVSTPEAAANSSGAEDISADISMKHLSDISNGRSRLVVEPFISKTYTGPNEEGYYYLYARFFNDLNSPEPNEDWGAVSVELETMEDQSEDILLLYDDVGNEVHGFYPSSQVMGGEPGFRIIRFNTKSPGTETKTQKIKITGRNLYTHEEFPLYREVEITLQKKQPLTVSLSEEELPLQKGAKQEVQVTIPADLPVSMFPLEFIIEAELPTLTPDNGVSNNNLPVHSGISISENEGFIGKNTIQFIRTLTLDEYKTLTVKDGMCTFSSFFKTNRAKSETTIWVSNEYFVKGHKSFTNLSEITGQFYIKINEDADSDCLVVLNNGNSLEYNIDETGWLSYTANQVLELERGHKVAFRATSNTLNWGSASKFYCYKKGSNKDAKNGQFSIGGNIASLLIGDNFIYDGETLSGNWSFLDLFKGHTGLTDASDLVLPMLKCQTSCYKSMFDSCTGLVSGPKELPATTIASTCYRNMFYNCSNLVNAPVILAEKIGSECFQRMFAGCSKLQFIELHAKNYDATSFKKSGEESWVGRVAATGVIKLDPEIGKYSNWENIIPGEGNERWDVYTLDGQPWVY